MSRRFVIDFDPRNGEDASSLTNRVRNLGESIHVELSRSGKGSISLQDIDKATNQLVVEVSSKRFAGSVKTLLEKEVIAHNFVGLARISSR